MIDEMVRHRPPDQMEQEGDRKWVSYSDHQKLRTDFENASTLISYLLDCMKTIAVNDETVVKKGKPTPMQIAHEAIAQIHIVSGRSCGDLRGS